MQSAGGSRRGLRSTARDLGPGALQSSMEGVADAGTAAAASGAGAM